MSSQVAGQAPLASKTLPLAAAFKQIGQIWDSIPTVACILSPVTWVTVSLSREVSRGSHPQASWHSKALVPAQ